MKALELTKEHKEKLLEMCKVLFPESYSKTWDIEGLFNYEPINYENFECFHWFEFCTLILSQKLDNFSANDFYDSLFYSHPIDYLYKLFKNKNYVSINTR